MCVGVNNRVVKGLKNINFMLTLAHLYIRFIWKDVAISHLIAGYTNKVYTFINSSVTHVAGCFPRWREKLLLFSIFWLVGESTLQ